MLNHKQLRFQVRQPPKIHLWAEGNRQNSQNTTGAFCCWYRISAEYQSSHPSYFWVRLKKHIFKNIEPQKLTIDGPQIQHILFILAVYFLPKIN